MSKESLFAELGITDASDIEAVENALMGHIKQHIQSVADQYDEATVQQEIATIRSIYRAFFEHSILWAKSEIEKSKSVKSVPDSMALKKSARQVMEDLQDNMVSFALCYMQLNRFMTLVRDEIKENSLKAVGIVPDKSVKWTSDTGVMLARQKKRKHTIDEFFSNFEKLAPVFAETDAIQSRIRTQTAAILSREDADRLDLGLRSSLRMADFEKARKLAQSIPSYAPRFGVDKKTAEVGLQSMHNDALRLIVLYESNAGALTGEDKKLFLTQPEMKLILDGMEQELRKIRAYLVKYNLPYMEYKLEALMRLKDKLLVIGSLEGLMTLYRRLIGGLARPIRTPEDARVFSGDVLERINFLLAHQFSEVPKIEADANRVVEEFRQARAEYQTSLDSLLQENESSILDEDVFSEQAI